MRSKWVRWAADINGKPSGAVPAKAIIDYLDDPKNRLTKQRIKELTLETFGEIPKADLAVTDLAVEVSRLKGIIERAQKESNLTMQDGQPALLIPYWFINAK